MNCIRILQAHDFRSPWQDVTDPLSVSLSTVTLSVAKGLARQQPLQDVTDPLSVSLSPVTLSAAKGLARRTQRCFAEFTLSEANGLSRTARIPLKSAHGASLLSKCLVQGDQPRRERKHRGMICARYHRYVIATWTWHGFMEARLAERTGGK